MKEKYLKCGLSLLLFLNISLIFSFIIKYVLKIKIAETNFNYVILELILDVIISIFLILIFRKELLEDLKKKIAIEDILEDVTMFFVIKIVLAIITSIISNLIGFPLSDSDNQSIIEGYAAAAPILMIISGSLLAPFNEELVFRCGIKGIFKNKKVFVIVSGLIFGLIHVVDNFLVFFFILPIGIILDKVKDRRLSTALIGLFVLMSLIYFKIDYGNFINLFKSIQINELLNAIPYIGIGIYLSFIYYKRDNIYNNIIIHGLNNFISLVLLLFLV